MSDSGTEPSRWLTPDQAAKYLQVSRATLINLVRSGAIPKPRALSSRILRYDRDAIDEALGAKPKDKLPGLTLDDVEW